MIGTKRSIGREIGHIGKIRAGKYFILRIWLINLKYLRSSWRYREMSQVSGGLLTWLRGRGEPWQAALADGTVTVTVNKNFTALEVQVKETDEIAIIPLRT